MIPEKEIRSESWSNEKRLLKELLDEVSMTGNHRNAIDSQISSLERIFDKANETYD